MTCNVADQSFEERLLLIELTEVQRQLQHAKVEAADAHAAANAASTQLSATTESMQQVIFSRYRNRHMLCISVSVVLLKACFTCAHFMVPFLTQGVNVWVILCGANSIALLHRHRGC